MQEVTLDWLPATGTLSNPLNRWPILTHHWLLPPPLVCPCDGMRILHPTQHEAQGDCWGSPSGRDHLWMYANADSTCTEVFWILPWIFQGYRSNVYCSVNSLDPKVPEELFSLIQFYKANKVTCREFSPSICFLSEPRQVDTRQWAFFIWSACQQHGPPLSANRHVWPFL